MRSMLFLVVSLSSASLVALAAGCGGSDSVPVGADGNGGSSGTSGASGGTSGASGGTSGASGGTSGASGGTSGTSGSSGADAATCPTYYADTDGDGFGSTTSKVSCTPPGAGWVTVGGDCDDTNDKVKPGQTSFFGVGYSSPISFDYDCSKKEDPKPGLKKATTCAVAAGGITTCTGDGYLPADPARAGAGVDPYCGSTRYQSCRFAQGQCFPGDTAPPGITPVECH